MTTAGQRASPASSTARGDGRVLALTRAGIWILLVLAAANGLMLYLLPGRADPDYAWSIRPPVNAAFIGAGFLAGTLATGLVLATAKRWRTFSTLPPALWVLASTLLAATIIHEDRFKWDYPLTWVWALVRAVAAWYALFGVMLLSCAIGLRRPAEAIIPYATLAAWSVLLLGLPVLHTDDVSGGGLWIALMLALLGLSAAALRVALPDRARL